MSKKIKIGMISLTSCEGCRVAILKLGEKLLDLEDRVEFSECSYLEDKPWPENFDVVFIEGTAITTREMELLKEARKRAKTLVAIGTCAHLGGVQEIKNYHDKEEILKKTYKYFDSIENPEIKGIKDFVKVDFTIPGCPINSEEFLKQTKKIINGEKPEIEQVPVCKDCPKAGTKDCLLTQKKICFGPWILGGCGAPCPSNALQCLGCRGFRDGVDAEIMKKTLESFATTEEIENRLEVFGLLDEFKKKIKEKNN
jgi:sulfhydrogenase subunit delta